MYTNHKICLCSGEKAKLSGVSRILLMEVQKQGAIKQPILAVRLSATFFNNRKTSWTMGGGALAPYKRLPGYGTQGRRQDLWKEGANHQEERFAREARGVYRKPRPLISNGTCGL